MKHKHINWISGKLPLKQSGVTRFVALFDLHYPHTLFLDAIFAMLSDTKPDYLILGGDIINNDPFNHWAKQKPGLTKQMPEPYEYFQEVNRDLMAPLRKAVGKRCKIVYIMGNHEDWSNKAVEMMPEGRGYFEVENNIESGLVDYFVKPRLLVALGDLWIGHGDNIPFSKNQHAKKMAMHLHRNVMFGHYHDYEIHSLSVAVDEKPLMGIAVPCLTETNPCSYGKELPNNRSHGFSVGRIRANGTFTTEVIQIQNGAFYCNNTQYQAKAKRKLLGYHL